jgi:hypothetical protein
MARIVLVFVWAIVLLSPLPTSAKESAKDYYDAQSVRSWVELPAGFAEGNSFLEKYIYRGGDRIALGIVHAFTDEEIMNPERLPKILSIIRLSFSRPTYITRDQDREPAVTKLLLFSLEQRCTDKKLAKDVVDTEIYVQSQVGGASARR